MQINVRNSLSSLVLVSVLAACNNTGSPGGPQNNGGGGNAAAPDFDQGLEVWVARNAGAAGTEVDRFSSGEMNGTPQTFTTNANENIFFDLVGNLTQAVGRSRASATGEAAGLREICRPGLRLDGGNVFNSTTASTPSSSGIDRIISNTGVAGPKGVVIAHKAGRIIVADTGSPGGITVYSTTVGAADAAVVATTDDVIPWDIAYDEDADRLFAALTNGTIAVFDNFLAAPNAATASRIITPSNPLSSTNLHGIAFNSNGLVVTDVGAGSSAVAGFDTDGSIYVFTDMSPFESGASSTVAAARVIRGPNSLLGNPVDIALDGTVLRVAEKANGGGQVLFFNNIFTGGSGDFAPDKSVDVAAVESIVTRPKTIALGADITDLDSTATLDFVLVSHNPDNPMAGPSAAEEGQMSRFVGSNAAAGTTFNVNDNPLAVPAERGLQNVAYDLRGDVYATFDNSVGDSGIIVINRKNARGDATTFDPALDRIITSTDITSPKGLEVIDAAGLLLVADTAGEAISVFSSCASGATSRLAFTDLDGLPDDEVVWDIDYEPSTDTLFASGTKGRVLVYDNYLQRLAINPNGGSAPDRTIQPTIGGSAPTPTNLHGIIFDAANNRLVVTDVGSAASPTDGAIYVINNAAAADGNVEVARAISGAATNLGNPVDIALNGSSLYVAEKSNDKLLIYTNVFTAAGTDPNTPANIEVDVVKAESVTLSPDYLGAAP